MDSPRILTKRGAGGGQGRKEGKREEEEVHSSSFGVARSLSITFYLSVRCPPVHRLRRRHRRRRDVTN